MKGHGLEALLQRLDTQALQQLHRHGRAQAVHKDHGAKAPGVMQAQHPLAGHQIEMVMRTGRRHLRAKRQGPGHAQMAEQHPVVHVDQEVLAAPAHCQHPVPLQMLRLATQGPAQRLAHAHRHDVGARNVLCKAAARDFNFG